METEVARSFHLKTPRARKPADPNGSNPSTKRIVGFGILSLAASILLAVALQSRAPSFKPHEFNGADDATSAIRGAEFRLKEIPTQWTSDVELEWYPVKGAVKYRLTLLDGLRKPLLEKTLDQPRFSSTDEIDALIRRGATRLTIQFEAIDTEGNPLATSTETEFELGQAPSR